MTLTIAQTAQIRLLIRYLKRGDAGKTIDDTVANALAQIFCGQCGFNGGCPGKFLEGIRDAPYATLLDALLCAATPVGAAGALNPNNPIAAQLSIFGSLGVLAGSTITNTGNSQVLGDLALSPGSAVTGFPPGVVLGTQHITDTAAANDQLALTAAYLAAAAVVGSPTVTVAGDLGGQTLTTGVYKSTSSLAISSGNLTLDAQGNSAATWVFQIASTLTVGNSVGVTLTGGAQAANIIWQVGSSATLGTSSIFKGTILALTSISVNTGALVLGRLLARNGAVTLAGNVVIAQ
jgi:hypothetical protein